MFPGYPHARNVRLASLTVLALVVFRSGVFVFWPQSHFDADSAITGLMATHLADGRAFPLFYYGQNYMLGVDAYLAAPFFALLGPSVTALKAPLLAVNMGVAVLLHRIFVRDMGLGPWLAIVPTLFFVVPAPGTAARIIEANGGNLGPFLYVVLLWTLRRRPAWAGCAAGVGFLHREFSLYGVFALLLVETVRSSRAPRVWLRHWGTVALMAGVVWGAVQMAVPYASAAGPGTTVADVYQPRNNVAELASRICLDIRATASGVPRLATEHVPVLFGSQRLALTDFGIDSSLQQGMDWSWLLLVILLVCVVATIAGGLMREGRWRGDYDAGLYFALVGVLSLAGYVVGRCGEVSFYWMRYDLLSLLGASGCVAWALAAAQAPDVPTASATQGGRLSGMRRAIVLLVVIWTAFGAVVHARLWWQYLTEPPEGGKQRVIRELDARGIRYAYADYWYAYAITFLTQERIVVASNSFMRIPFYNTVVDAHRNEAVRISREPCEGGEEVVRRVYFCGAGSGGTAIAVRP
jgi:hypothetical protein